MKSKTILSSFALLLFALLGGGSIDVKETGMLAVFIIVVIALAAIIGFAGVMVENNNKNKRLRMINEDERNSTDFDRSVSIGNDRMRIYFDSNKKQVMLMKVMIGGIKKEYVDDFEFPGKELAFFTDPVFNIYDPVTRRLLYGTYDVNGIKYQITSIAEKDNNKDVNVNNTIQPRLVKFMTSHTSSVGTLTNKLYNILIEENHGLIAVCSSSGVGETFNYISANSLLKKTGETSTINTQKAGNYLFVTDDFFKVLVIVGENFHEIFNYADIIDVSYVENGDQLYTKSTGRTVGGAIVGGVLMGGAGAVIGGLSGDSKQSKVIKSINIKILLRSTSRTSCVLYFKDISRNLNTKEESDRKLYNTYVKRANQAKDILSVIIDNAKQSSIPVTPPVVQQVITPTLSIADELSKLADLKDRGILTEEEFQVQKQVLLHNAQTTNNSLKEVKHSQTKAVVEDVVPQEVREALNNNDKILAVKLYMDYSGCGLSEAKDYIDSID